MTWRIWYTDGSVFDGVSGADWVALPDTGVAGIAVFFSHDEYGRRLGEFLSGSDWYWWSDGTLHQNGASSLTPGEWLEIDPPSGAIVKAGQWTTNENMAAISAAMADWATNG